MRGFFFSSNGSSEFSRHGRDLGIRAVMDCTKTHDEKDARGEVYASTRIDGSHVWSMTTGYGEMRIKGAMRSDVWCARGGCVGGLLQSVGLD